MMMTTMARRLVLLLYPLVNDDSEVEDQENNKNVEDSFNETTLLPFIISIMNTLLTTATTTATTTTTTTIAAAQEGLRLVVGTLLFTAMLEFGVSKTTVQNIKRQQPNLYRQAWMANMINHFGIGIPCYVLSVTLFCTNPTTTTSTTDGNGMEEMSTTWFSFSIVLQVQLLLWAHAIQYYYIHKWFHSNPWLYQTFHKFHHLFHHEVVPSTANAVTMGEFLLAYLMPFVTPLVVLVPTISSHSLQIAISILSACNILVHTPSLEPFSQTYIPWFWVGTHDHLHHHRTVYNHYASPTWNIDALWERLQQLVIANANTNTNTNNSNTNTNVKSKWEKE